MTIFRPTNDTAGENQPSAVAGGMSDQNDHTYLQNGGGSSGYWSDWIQPALAIGPQLWLNGVGVSAGGVRSVYDSGFTFWPPPDLEHPYGTTAAMYWAGLANSYDSLSDPATSQPMTQSWSPGWVQCIFESHPSAQELNPVYEYWYTPRVIPPGIPYGATVEYGTAQILSYTVTVESPNVSSWVYATTEAAYSRAWGDTTLYHSAVVDDFDEITEGVYALDPAVGEPVSGDRSYTAITDGWFSTSSPAWDQYVNAARGVSPVLSYPVNDSYAVKHSTSFTVTLDAPNVPHIFCFMSGSSAVFDATTPPGSGPDWSQAVAVPFPSGTPIVVTRAKPYGNQESPRVSVRANYLPAPVRYLIPGEAGAYFNPAVDAGQITLNTLPASLTLSARISHVD